MKTNTAELPREVTVNKDQGLYVIPCGEGRTAGYTCLGFENADRKARAVLAWLNLSADGMLEPGTIEHYRQYEAMMQTGAQWNAKTGKRCDAELTPELIGLEGKRVEVTTPAGDKSRFYVGKSTGWMPCHLEIKTRASSGGCAVYFPKGATVRVIHGKERY